MRQIEALSYCPRCGAKANPSSSHLDCAGCGLKFYLNPKPCTSVILKNSRGEYLFVRRALEPRKGYLDFPGGFAEEDETLLECSWREVNEELGLDIDGQRLQFLSEHKDRYDYQGIDYGTIGVSYVGDFPEGANLKTADDVDGYEFYRLKDIPMDRLAWPSMREMIAALKSQKLA